MEGMTLRQVQQPLVHNVEVPQEQKSSVFVPVIIPATETGLVTTRKPLSFIEANTTEVTIDHLKGECIIPVFSKDNEETIAHQSFIETIYEAACEVFRGERIDAPAVRVSHIVKGRIPEAIHKPASQLLDSEKTIYYERMMFCFEIPSIYQDVAGNRLNLTIGGVRAYNQENLYAKKTAEKFKLFIGFKNLVCCNLCVSTDGYKACLKAMDTMSLYQSAVELFRSYDMQTHLRQMAAYQNYRMSESQFAQFIGKCRLYQYLPNAEKKVLPSLQMTDTQISLVANAYFNDSNFCKNSETREISLWRVFNLLTGANKSSYIDNFLDRAQNAGELTTGLCRALEGDAEYSWFLS